jgi:membrane-associated phospholipid phosphatase
MRRSLATVVPMPKHLPPHWAVAIRVGVGLCVASLFSLLFARILSDLSTNTSLIRADLRLSTLVQSFRTPAFTRVMIFATDLGRWQGIVSGAIALGLGLALWRRKADIVALVLALSFGEVAVWLIKTLIHRARPEPANALTFEGSYSFPSGHAFVATVFYGLACYVLFRVTPGATRVLVVLSGLALVLAIGFSRVYLGVHWPSDVLASYTAAVVWLAATITPLAILDRNPSSHGSLFSPRLRSVLVALIGILWPGTIVLLYSSIPLRQPHTVPIVVPIIAEDDIPKRLFESLPKTSEDISGRPMEPINIVLVGPEEKVRAAFAAAGWTSADPLSLHSLRREVVAIAKKAPYPEQPGTPTFWNGRPNLLTFEKSTPQRTIRERHHIHLWNSGLNSSSGKPVWMATAHFDKGFKRASMPVPVHAIDPDIDRQREYVRHDLEAAGAVQSVTRLPVTGTLTGKNFAGDSFFTDGTACLLVLR